MKKLLTEDLLNGNEELLKTVKTTVNKTVYVKKDGSTKSVIDGTFSSVDEDSNDLTAMNQIEDELVNSTNNEMDSFDNEENEIFQLSGINQQPSNNLPVNYEKDALKADMNLFKDDESGFNKFNEIITDEDDVIEYDVDDEDEEYMDVSESINQYNKILESTKDEVIKHELEPGEELLLELPDEDEEDLCENIDPNVISEINNVKDDIKKDLDSLYKTLLRTNYKCDLSLLTNALNNYNKFISSCNTVNETLNKPDLQMVDDEPIKAGNNQPEPEEAEKVEVKKSDKK